MKDIYKGMYSQQHCLELKGNRRIKVMLDFIDALDLHGRNILDIGCYDGTFLSKIKNRDNAFYGVEASDFGVKQCQEKGIQVTQFFFDDDTPFPMEECSMDVIIIGEIIEHIYETDFFLEEIKRILKPDGKLIVSTPNIASFGRRLMLLLGINPIIETSPNEKNSSGHIRYFTFKSLEQLLGKHGFKVVRKKSDVINFSSNGKCQTSILANLCMTLGQSIIYLCKKS